MSDICGTCRGTGYETVERAELVKNDKGEGVVISTKYDIVCRQCKGLGEYPII